MYFPARLKEKSWQISNQSEGEMLLKPSCFEDKKYLYSVIQAGLTNFLNCAVSE